MIHIENNYNMEFQLHEMHQLVNIYFYSKMSDLFKLLVSLKN
jgi:hypothetical protein